MNTSIHFIVSVREPYKSKCKYIAGVNKNGTLKLTPHSYRAVEFSEAGADVVVQCLKQRGDMGIVSKEGL